MRQVAKLSAFVLLIIGTLGLVINELIFDWGRIATLILAFTNTMGLAILAFTHSGIKEDT